jgi:hypothetical protein
LVKPGGAAWYRNRLALDDFGHERKTDMTSGVFDTLKLARALRDNAHFSAEDAEGAAAAIAEAIQSDVATKSDVRLAVSELRTEISECKYETIKSVAGMIGFQAIAMIGAIAALLHLSH